MNLRTAVLIPAAGSSSRFGGKRPKQFVDLDGRAVFIRTIEAFAQRDDVKKIVVAISREEQEMYEIKWGAKLDFYGVTTVIGGAERWQTVQNLLAAVKDTDLDLIAIHDAARPCISDSLITRVFQTAYETGAALPASRLVGTVKKAGADLNIENTVDRSELWEAQTPQTFKPEIIFQAYDNLSDQMKNITDDSQLVEAMGVPVKIVESDSTNLKITHGIDLAYATVIIKNMAAAKEQEMKKADKAFNPFAEDHMW